MAESEQTTPDVGSPNAGVLMFIGARAMEQRVYAAVRAAGFEGTLTQARLAARIGPDGTRLTELAESGQVTKQTAGFLVDQLEHLGYVERVPDPVDKRARLIRVAERGRQAQAVARQVEREIEAEWTRHLGSRDMAKLYDILTRLREIADPYA